MWDAGKENSQVTYKEGKTISIATNFSMETLEGRITWTPSFTRPKRPSLVNSGKLLSTV